MGIPGGYTGKGTTGMDKDTYFGIHPCTRTRTRHTRTHNGGYILHIQCDFPNQVITICSYYYIMLQLGSTTPTHRTNIYTFPYFFCTNIHSSSHLFFSTMARDEVDLALILNDHRKRKLGSYATNEDNISADKEAVVKRMKLTINAANNHDASCEQKKLHNILTILLNYYAKHPYISMILLKKLKKRILRL
jgi:hypothetical protein